MEGLPVEVIGIILSRLGSAREVVAASTTCRKWREAYREHLHTLSFNSADWPWHLHSTFRDLEIMITRAIFQTKGLQGLSIMIDGNYFLSPSSVYAWLFYTRETLRELRLSVWTIQNVNVIEIFAGQKIEVMDLKYCNISRTEPKFHKFPCLKSLTLHSVLVTAFDLKSLISACPKIEVLELAYTGPGQKDSKQQLELISPTLKEVLVDSVYFRSIVLKTERLETLHLKDCGQMNSQLLRDMKANYSKNGYVALIIDTKPAQRVKNTKVSYSKNGYVMLVPDTKPTRELELEKIR